MGWAGGIYKMATNLTHRSKYTDESGSGLHIAVTSSQNNQSINNQAAKIKICTTPTCRLVEFLAHRHDRAVILWLSFRSPFTAPLQGMTKTVEIQKAELSRQTLNPNT